MKMKQISDTTLKITMTLDDLMDRGMEIVLTFSFLRKNRRVFLCYFR